MVIETSNLKTVENFAKEYLNRRGTPVSRHYIYGLIREAKRDGIDLEKRYGFNYVDIDGAFFIYKVDQNKK